MAKVKSLSVLGGEDQREVGETERKAMLGQRIWRAWAGAYERSKVLIEAQKWEECEALFFLMLTAFTRQALPEEMDAFDKMLLKFNGERSLVQKTPGIDPRTGQYLPRKVAHYNYGNRYFQEWFWPRMREQVKAYVGSLFDGYIVGSFGASALEAELEKRDLEVSANTPFTGETVAGIKQESLRLAAVIEELEEA